MCTPNLARLWGHAPVLVGWGDSFIVPTAPGIGGAPNEARGSQGRANAGAGGGAHT